MPDGQPKTPFDNSYARLPARFYARLNPTPVRAPRLLRLNRALAAELGLSLEGEDEAALAEIFSGNRILDGAEPIAMAYAGHQFGGWSPQLGDGRAHLLGEVIGKDGRRDIQLKGSGPTPFSRMGDGRAPLGPVIREYILCEAMAALGVPTTRALAAVTTGEPVARDAVLPGAVFTRVAASHIRVGTFQFFGARHDDEGLRLLADHVIARHFPAIEGDADTRARALLDAVIARQAALIAEWMSLGFIHGVMNTDNMTVSGETIDYGPCAFMDAFHPDTVFSSIDRQGRYAYAMQPKIGHWNLAQFAMALIPLLAGDEDAAIESAKAALDAYPAAFEAAWLGRMRAKLGLTTAEEEDRALVEALLALMAASAADFTGTFRALAHAAAGDEASIRAALGAGAEAWLTRWQTRLAREEGDGQARGAAMRGVSPAYIPRNHLVEEAIRAAYEEDLTPFNALLDVIANPFEEREGLTRYAVPPRPEERVRETFCGT